MSNRPQARQPEFIDFAADIVSAYVSNNYVQITEIPGLIASVHASLSGLGQPPASPRATNRRLDELLPWAYASAQGLKAVA